MQQKTCFLLYKFCGLACCYSWIRSHLRTYWCYTIPTSYVCSTLAYTYPLCRIFAVAIPGCEYLVPCRSYSRPSSHVILAQVFPSQQERDKQLCSISTQAAMDEAAGRFVDWFKTHGSQHVSAGLTDFAGMGRGAIALDDIAVRAR